jgi:hypothetical protein
MAHKDKENSGIHPQDDSDADLFNRAIDKLPKSQTPPLTDMQRKLRRIYPEKPRAAIKPLFGHPAANNWEIERLFKGLDNPDKD